MSPSKCIFNMRQYSVRNHIRPTRIFMGLHLSDPSLGGSIHIDLSVRDETVCTFPRGQFLIDRSPRDMSPRDASSNLLKSAVPPRQSRLTFPEAAWLCRPNGFHCSCGAAVSSDPRLCSTASCRCPGRGSCATVPDTASVSSREQRSTSRRRARGRGAQGWHPPWGSSAP